MTKAIVLLSGGMDSAVTLYIARKEHDCSALIFDYGQRAGKEIDCARRIAEKADCPYQVLKIDLPRQGSSLLDRKRDVPPASEGNTGGIPDTYVPARNIVFLSFGVAFAEAAGAGSVFIGAHQLDFSNYPDCRGEFFDSFRETVRRGTKTGSEGHCIKIETPVLNSTKKEIVEKGLELGVPFEETWSCYRQASAPCGVCESCMFRIKAFEEAGAKDPLMKT